MSLRLSRFAVLIVTLTAAGMIAGCGDSAATDGAHGGAGENGHTEAASTAHDHSGWWCGEHGVPEGACARCDASLASGFKEKGDWCADHSRPKSQCFVCDPSLQDQFADRYEAKFGKRPPKPTDP